MIACYVRRKTFAVDFSSTKKLMNPKVYPINRVNYNWETELFYLIIGKICFFLTNDFYCYCYLNKEDFQNLLSEKYDQIVPDKQRITGEIFHIRGDEAVAENSHSI